MNDFRKELEQLINRHSVENQSDTPDWILAQYVLDCLDAFKRVTGSRDAWYGFKGLSKKTSRELKP